MARTKHYHSSSLGKNTPLSLWLAVKSALGWNDLITLTEVQDNTRVARLKKIPGWRFVQVEGGGMDECAVIFAQVKWRFLKVEAKKLSEMPVPANGRYVWAVTVWLQHRLTEQILIISVAHLPAHVEQTLLDGRRTDTVKCYEDCVHTWRDYLLAKRTKGVSIMAVADWNLNVRRDAVQKWLVNNFTGFKSSWVQGDRMPADGTFGDRLIDDTRSHNLTVEDIELAKDDASSDHRPYRETLIFP